MGRAHDPRQTPADSGASHDHGSSDPGAHARVASARTPGFDIARAIAILGMVLVNFSAMADLPEGRTAADWFLAQIEGKAAALFVVLAGIGVSLRVRSAERRGLSIGFEQRALVRRALVLFVLGLVHRHFWDWDILHMYGVFLLCAALLLRASSAVLLTLAAVLIGATVPLQLRFDYYEMTEFWTLAGALSEIGFNGLFPVVPWLSFLLVGVVLGRIDLQDESVRRELLLVCVPVILGLEGLNAWADTATDGDPPYPALALWALSWPRPPTPAFALTGIAYSILIVCVAIELSSDRADRPWALALTATGQLALSVYLAHGAAITIAVLHHDWFSEGTQLQVIAFGLLFYLVSIWFAWRWRLRWRYGPVELIVRQLSSGSPAAPWGGAPLAEADRPPER